MPDANYLSPEQYQFIEDMGLYYENYSIPRIGGRIFGLLLIAPEPLTAEDISDHLSVARSSVSTNIRMLMVAGLVSRTSRRGDRRDYYLVPETAWPQSVQHRIHSLNAVQPLIQRGLQAVPETHPARERLNRMQEWTDFLTQTYQQALVDWEQRKK